MSQAVDLYRDTLSNPDVIRESWTLAAKISSTEFVPKAFRGRPEAVMAAMLTGREVGMGPMSALQRIHVIDGRPAIDAQGQRALVLGVGHEIWAVESTPASCTYSGRRAGSQNVQTVTWTMKDAQTAGLTNKDNWRKWPRQMLAARASAELCRMVAPDALQGLGLTVEELTDEQPVTVQRARKTTPDPAQPGDLVRVTTTATVPQNGHTPRPAPAWDDDDVTDAEIVDTPPERTVTHDWATPTEPALPLEDGELATSKQVSKLSILFNRAHWDDPAIDAYIEKLSDGRTTSRKELTKTEASKAIDELEQVAS